MRIQVLHSRDAILEHVKKDVTMHDTKILPFVFLQRQPKKPKNYCQVTNSKCKKIIKERKALYANERQRFSFTYTQIQKPV